MLHYFRTTPDGRIAFGWGGGRMALGARPARRLDVDADVAARTRATRAARSSRSSPGGAITHAWGGPIDVSPTSLPSSALGGDPVHAGWGFTGNGVGPSHLGGRILSALALDRRDEVTRLPLVEPAAGRFPPEPRASRAARDPRGDGARGRSPTMRAARSIRSRRLSPPCRAGSGCRCRAGPAPREPLGPRSPGPERVVGG